MVNPDYIDGDVEPIDQNQSDLASPPASQKSAIIQPQGTVTRLAQVQSSNISQCEPKGIDTCEDPDDIDRDVGSGDETPVNLPNLDDSRGSHQICVDDKSRE